MTGARRALLVANDTYEHEGLERLHAPAADVRALAGVLGDPGIGGFDVRVVRDEPAHTIQREIEDMLADSRAGDVVLLHFSCHGLKSDSGELFFAARTTRPDRLASTAVPADFVQRCMRTSRSRTVVLFLDCCYGGAFGRGVTVRAGGAVDVLDSFAAARAGGGRGRAVITASSAMEYAFEGDHLAGSPVPRPSVFTSALVEGLSTGLADRNGDGWVSLDELYDYVFDKVRERTPHQTPSRYVEMQGDLYLARTPDSPAPPPPPVEEPPVRSRQWWPWAVSAAVALAAAAVLTVVLTGDSGDDPPAARGDADRLTATAPWRLRVRDNIQGHDSGCTVTMTHDASGSPVDVPAEVYGTIQVQVHQSGTFTWRANDKGCLVIPYAGAGEVALPFAKNMNGDTDAFTVAGRVAVEVTDFQGNPECEVVLHDAATGDPADFGSATPDSGRLVLDPGGRTQVYVAGRYCVLRVTAA
ncbi:caspase family protein [Symbioplanes lichenis]|uniref:caspase family protein n=1 Tax=Symbioplanes lichenis TaxID=1629072 RepID=UPI0027397232|nr:caspase family protein [Actinoplanes lichenis]